MLIKAILGKLGRIVEIAEDGAGAVRDSDFDLALIDVNMPELDGLAATIRAMDSPATDASNLVDAVERACGTALAALDAYRSVAA